jgi:hypothetical protein
MFYLLHRYMQNAFSWRLRSVTAERLRNCAELAEDQAGRPIGCWRERGDRHGNRAANALGRAPCRVAGLG